MFGGPSRTVIGGPFADTHRLVAGLWIWDVKDVDGAVAWVKRSPNPMPGPNEIAIRRMFDVEEFGEALMPELAEGEDRLRGLLSKGSPIREKRPPTN